MKKLLEMISVTCLSILLITVCTPNSVSATPSADWTQNAQFYSWAWNDPADHSLGWHWNPYDTLGWFIFGGQQFADLGLDNFQTWIEYSPTQYLITATTDWQANVINPYYAIASGKDAVNNKFTFYFAGDMNDPFTLVGLAWLDATFVTGVKVDWTGSGFANQILWYSLNDDPFLQNNPSAYDRSPVPEPTTLILLGSGLVALAGFRRKFRK